MKRRLLPTWLDVNPPSAPGGFEAVFRYAAELTLRNGYSVFRLTRIYVQASNNFGVTVVMFHTSDRSAADVFDAAAVLNPRSF